MKILNQLIQYFQHHLNRQRTKIQYSFLILSIITLIKCSDFSGYICNYNPDIWYEYFVVVERIAMLFLLLSCFKYLQEKSWFLTELIFCFLTQDILDRLFFNIREINTNDYITISLLLIIALIKFKNKYNDNTRTNKEII